jgi:hypothetical protein
MVFNTENHKTVQSKNPTIQVYCKDVFIALRGEAVSAYGYN